MSVIPGYTRPQTEISQVLETTSNPTLDRLHAVVVGPAYLHADADANNLVFDTYRANSSVPYSVLRAGSAVTLGTETVVLDATRVVAKDLRLELFASKTGFAPLASDAFGNVIEYAAGVLDTTDPAVAAAFDYGRQPTVGDVFRIEAEGNTTIERKVTGLLGKDLEAIVGDALYTGAAEWTNSSANAEVSLNYASIPVTPGGVVLQSAPGNVSKLYARANGTAGLGSSGGLRLVLDITCTLGAGVVAGSTFSALVNGVPTALTVAAISSTGTRFTTLTDLVINLTEYKAWTTGDRVTINCDFAQGVDTTLFDAAFDASGYNYAASNKRVASSLVVSVLAVTNTQATIRISDTNGLLVPVTKILTAGANTASLAYDQGTIAFSLTVSDIKLFHTNQSYSLLVTPPSRSTTLFDKIKLNAPIGTIGGAVALTVTARVPFSGTLTAFEPVLGGTNFTAGTDSVSVGTITVAVPGYTQEADSVKPAVDGLGTLAIQWKAQIPAGANEGLVAIDTDSDILNAFYSTKEGSELGHGLWWALQGAQYKRVYGLNTGGTDEASFRTAFDKLESANLVYSIAVLTSDEAIMQMAASHVQAMSAPTVKKFRRAYVGTDSPGEYPILGLKPDDTAYTASVSVGSGGGYTLVEFEDGVDLSLLTITRGDKFLVTGTGQTYLIDTVTGERTLTLQSGPASPIGLTAAQIIAADTPANTARFVWQRAERLGAGEGQQRRIVDIWTDNGMRGGVPVANRFQACEAAGLRSAAQPHQGLTRTEVACIDAAPSMYTKFKPALLDEIASHGVWIVTQDSAEGTPYIRHQLTTAASYGNLAYEDSAGTNIDSICFMLNDYIDPLIGKRNATPRTVVEIKNNSISKLNELTKETLANGELGPQLIAFYNMNADQGTIDVEIDANLKDTINWSAVLEVGLPLNRVRVLVLGKTATGATGATTTALSTQVI